MTIKNVSRHCQMSLGGSASPVDTVHWGEMEHFSSYTGNTPIQHTSRYLDASFPRKGREVLSQCSLGTTTWYLYCPRNGLTLSDQGYLWALQIQPLQNLPDYGEKALNPASPSGSNALSKVCSSWHNSWSNNTQLSKYATKYHQCSITEHSNYLVLSQNSICHEILRDSYYVAT